MKCKLENRENLISRYLLNELSDEESLKFEEHYFMCEECFNEVRAAEDIFNFISREGKSAFNTSNGAITDKIFSLIKTLTNPVKIGFAFAILLLLFVLYFTLKKDSTKPVDEQKILTGKENVIKQETDTLITQSKKPYVSENNLISDNLVSQFKPNPYYEEWLNENVRSENKLVERVFYPLKNDTIFSSVIEFKWKMKEKLPVKIIILNNLEDEIFSSIVSDESFPNYQILVSTSKFKSGLYYWKIEDENEVLYLSKFILIRE